MKKRLAYLLFIAAILVGGCNNGVVTPPVVGSITHVGSPLAYVNDVETSDGASLFRGSTVSTDGSGSVSLGLHVKDFLCNLLSDSRLQVEPDGETVVSWIAGEAMCATSGGAGTCHTLTANKTTVDLVDPVFAVIVRGADDTVKVSRGFVRVGSLATGGTVILGPGQQTVIAAGQSPLPPMPIELTVLEQQLFDELNPRFIAPEFGQPADFSKSVTLTRIFERGVILASVDVAQLQNEPAYWFAGQMLDLLAQAWGVKVDMRELRPEEAQQQMEASELDLLISPQAFDQLAGIPFFQEKGSGSWALLFLEDESFRHGLEAFLRVAIERTDYAGLYMEAFGESPSYQAFEEFLFRP